MEPARSSRSRNGAARADAAEAGEEIPYQLCVLGAAVVLRADAAETGPAHGAEDAAAEAVVVLRPDAAEEAVLQTKDLHTKEWP